MNNEKMNQIIDEVWKKYLDETRFTSNPEWLEPVPVMDMKTGEKAWGARQYRRNDFINKIKTDSEFSEKWGLKIEERELNWEERHKLYVERCLASGNGLSGSAGPDGRNYEFYENLFAKYYVPTKLITITYKNETIKNL